MRTVAFAAVALFALPVASACGGSDPSDLFGNPFGDAGPGSGDGSSADAAACDLSKCAINVPAGFRLLTYATDRSKDCQAGWKTTDVLSDPVADPATCSCACNVTTPPDCSKGTIHRFNGFSTCTTAATSVVATGLCDPIAGGITCDQ